MTDHVFKVGDKGLAKNGETYEVLWVGQECMVVRVGAHEYKYYLEGEHADILPANTSAEHDLIPPKRRIQGWVNVFTVPHDTFPMRFVGPWENKDIADQEARIFKVSNHGAKRVDCFYYDREKGEGL